LSVIKAQLIDTKRVYEIYKQFGPVLDGTLTSKVARVLSTVRENGIIGEPADKEYAAIIKEVRFYLKLSRQLPTIVFLPMFEIGVRCVKDEI